MFRHHFLALAAAALGSTAAFAQGAPPSVVQTSDTTEVLPTTTGVEVAPSVLRSPEPVGLHVSRISDDKLAPQDTTRRKAVAYSDWYERRLRVHRYGSYAMLPLFVAQYVLGDKLIDQKNAQYNGTRTTPIDQNLRSTHKVVAGAVGALFVVNTTTGLWNLIESRHAEEGRKLRTVHAITMLLADAGFAYTGYLSANAVDRGPPQARKHRNIALGSFAVSTAGASLMWFGRD